MRSLRIATTLVAALVTALGAASPMAAQSHSTRVTMGSNGDTARVITVAREIFQYSAAGRRDPFVSLMSSSELRPTIADLRLTTVAYDPTGGNSVAILRDLGTKEQYRVKTGSLLGRMHVVSIEPKAVTFAIEEFGFSRQETLMLGDSTRTRTP